MDEPIIFENHSSPEEEPLNFYERLEYAILDDEIEEFLRLIEDPEFERVCHAFEADKIFLVDALKIGTAVLEGELEGIIDIEDVLEDGWTPLHLAAVSCAPRMTEYLLERGDNVDLMCDYDVLGLKQATPIDLAVETIDSSHPIKISPPEWRLPWTPRKSIFELLYYVCETKRSGLEVVRMLIQKTQNAERVRKAFADYAEKGQLVQLTALFLAAPELFLSSRFASLGSGLSSFSMLYPLLNSLEKRTDLGEGMSLLLDVFAIVGDKLVAYVRLDNRYFLMIDARRRNWTFKTAFLLREVAHKKLGVSSRDDYFLRFFKPLTPYVDPRPHQPYFPCAAYDEHITFLPFDLKRKEIDMDYINEKFSNLEPPYAAILNRAIENKLSSMSSLRGLFESFAKISKKGEKHLPEEFSWFNGEPSVGSSHTNTARAKPVFDSKFTPTNKVMMPTKLKSVFSFVKLSNLPMIAKRLIRL